MARIVMLLVGALCGHVWAADAVAGSAATQQFLVERENIATELRPAVGDSDLTEVATLKASGTFDNGHILGVLTTAEDGYQDHILFAVGKTFAKGAPLQCSKDIRLEGLYPTWSPVLRKTSGSQYLVLMLGEGGDGLEQWTSAAVFTVDTSCKVELITKEEGSSYCEDADASHCSGVKVVARIRHDGAVEIETRSGDLGTSTERASVRVVTAGGGSSPRK